MGWWVQRIFRLQRTHKLFVFFFIVFYSHFVFSLQMKENRLNNRNSTPFRHRTPVAGRTIPTLGIWLLPKTIKQNISRKYHKVKPRQTLLLSNATINCEIKPEQEVNKEMTVMARSPREKFAICHARSVTFSPNKGPKELINMDKVFAWVKVRKGSQNINNLGDDVPF